jgi:phosphosulfolactate synthase (CoM biosynthesis protein A)
MTENYYSLFATPSFIGGMARTLDLGSTLTQYNTSPTPQQADYIAISSDWIYTGNDIKYAMGQFIKEEDVEKK